MIRVIHPFHPGTLSSPMMVLDGLQLLPLLAADVELNIIEGLVPSEQKTHPTSLTRILRKLIVACS